MKFSSDPLFSMRYFSLVKELFPLSACDIITMDSDSSS